MDWRMHHRLSTGYQCGGVVVAQGIARQAEHPDRAFLHALTSYASRVCRPDGDPLQIKKGMSTRDVVDVAGAPRFWLSGGSCWTFPTTRRISDSLVSLRVCFTVVGGLESISFGRHG